MSSTKNSSHVVRAVRAKTDQNRRGTKYNDLRTNPPGVFISRQEASKQDMTNLEKNPFFSNLFPFSIVHFNMFALVSKSQTTKQLYCSYVGAFGRELMVFFFLFVTHHTNTKNAKKTVAEKFLLPIKFVNLECKVSRISLFLRKLSA